MESTTNETARVSVVKAKCDTSSCPELDTLTLQFRDRADLDALRAHDRDVTTSLKQSAWRSYWLGVSRFLPADLGEAIRVAVNATPHARGY